MDQTYRYPGEPEFRQLLAESGISERTIEAFRKIVRSYYRDNGRGFPWRETRDPYEILVSEVMLQQTQTSRVTIKYAGFLAAFTDVRSLAEAEFEDVLRLWKGLGYNRRALALHRAAKVILDEHAGRVPQDQAALRALPGIGHYTAAAVAAFAFNTPTVFIETNIRAVFLHFFFEGAGSVHDREILPLIEKTLDRDDPREWYYGLFDLGASLKERRVPVAASAHYRRQSPFKGSVREVRGRILDILLEDHAVSLATLEEKTGRQEAELRKILARLQKEGFLEVTGRMVTIVSGEYVD